MTQLFLNKQKQFTSCCSTIRLTQPTQNDGRGYSYTTKEDRVVKTVTELQPADQLTIHYADGTVSSKRRNNNSEKRGVLTCQQKKKRLKNH